MNVVLKTAPTLYPISMAELKMHLRVDSETLDGNLTLTQSLAYGSKAIANNYTTHVGTGVDVLGKQAEVLLHCGTNGATGTNDTRIEEADALAGPYTAWTGGAFTQVTTANDNADYKKQYTGSKQYIRTASKVLLAACEFGTSILVNAATTAEDDRLEILRKAAVKAVEKYTRRQLLTATWYYYLDAFPADNFIKIPFGNLQSAGLVLKYKDSDATETTMTLTTDYLIETNGEGIGRIVLPYGESWPSDVLYPSNPITIEFACGWAAAANVPEDIVIATLFEAESQYFHGEREALLRDKINNLLYSYRLWDEF